MYDSIYAGAMPGLSTIEDIFSDDIHLNDIGKFFVACVHFSTLFSTSPVGRTNQLQVWWGGDFEAPSPALALKFQEMAWDISLGYQHSCIAPTVSIDEHAPASHQLKVYPNPVRDVLYIENGTQGPNLIYNAYGELVLSSDDHAINTASLPSGVYFIVCGGRVVRFVKL